MKALVIHQTSDQSRPLADCIRFESDFPDPPAPGPGWATVRTLASALNHLDLWVARGVPGLNLTYPRISGSDACGVVEAVGPGVDQAWIGKRVMLNAAFEPATPRTPVDPPGDQLAPAFELIGEHHNGTHAERFNAPIANLAVVPDHTDPTRAAAFGLTFLTAYSMMITKAGLRPGQSVLIPGIGGGVALAALAIARHLGCRSIVTSRHAWKLEKAATLGADECVLDTGQDWSKQVREWSNRRGVELAVDSAGKATHLKCIKSLARGGAYVTPGCTSGPDATTDLARIFWNQLRIFGSTMGSNAEFAQVVSLFLAGHLEPQVHGGVAAESGLSAYLALSQGEQFGKMVIDWR